MEKQKHAMRQVSGQVEDDGGLLDNAVLRWLPTLFYLIEKIHSLSDIFNI